MMELLFVVLVCSFMNWVQDSIQKAPLVFIYIKPINIY